MAQNQSSKPLEENNPVMNFVQDFQLNYNKLGIVHFEATINYKVENSIFKMHQTKVHIKNSGAQPMDIISLINPDIDSTMYPTMFFYAADEISYMPNQFLIIKGNTPQYGDYNVLIFPRV